MIGRAAMSAPWIFHQIKHYLTTGDCAAAARAVEKWDIIQQHCRLAVEEWGAEDPAMRSMRARLMAYSKGFPASKSLREKFQHVSTLSQLAEIAAEHLSEHESVELCEAGDLEALVP